MFLRQLIAVAMVTLSSFAAVARTTSVDRRIFDLPEVQASDLVPYYQQRLLKMFPQARVDVTGPLELTVQERGREEKVVLSLSNLLMLLNQEPSERRSHIGSFLALARSYVLDARNLPTATRVQASNVLPAIRSANVFDSYSTTERPVSMSLASGVAVFFADSKEGISFVQPEKMRRSDLNEAQLHAISVRNFDKMAARAKVTRTAAHYRASVARVSYSSSLPLAPSFYTRMRSMVGSDLIVAMPDRDTVLVANAGDAKAVEEIRSIAARSQSPYWVSRNIYRWTGSGQLSLLY